MEKSGHLPPTRPRFEELYPTLAYVKQYTPGSIRRLERYHAKIAQFREEVIAPRAIDIEREAHKTPGYLPQDVLRRACDLQLFSATVPDALGGLGLPMIGIPTIAEEIAAGCAGVANLLFVNMLGVAAIGATLDLKIVARILPQTIQREREGRPYFIATALTEPGAGSDMEDTNTLPIARTCTRVRPVPTGYEVTGTKVFISNGSLADLIVLLTPPEPGRPLSDMQLFLVTPDLPGFKVGRVERKMGTLACPAVELVFDRCVIPRKNKVDSQVEPADIIRLVLGLTRSGVGAFGAGVARRAFELALNHAFTTRVAGRPLIDHQWVQFELTALARNAMTARAAFMEGSMANGLWGLMSVMGAADFPGMSLVPKVVKRLVFGKGIFAIPTVSRMMADRVMDPGRQRQSDYATGLGDHAKITGSDLAVENARRAILLMGQDGIRSEGQVEKLYRDAKLLQIYEGTNQVNGIDFFERTVFGSAHSPAHPAHSGVEVAREALSSTFAIFPCCVNITSRGKAISTP
ncbi:MAG: acyl-CoA/acyl-ACP dehydrogenase [Nitrospirae bacterium]|nr:acyl-CoA/acyl-ACP dehydrogenase [Nitrospirota bacterium]